MHGGTRADKLVTGHAKELGLEDDREQYMPLSLDEQNEVRSAGSLALTKMDFGHDPYAGGIGYLTVLSS